MHLQRFAEKASIFLICLIGFFFTDHTESAVAALLVSVILSMSVQISPKRSISAVILLTASALCAVSPAFLCAFPLFLFDALFEKMWWTILPSSYAFIQVVHRMQYQKEGCIALIGAGITVILYYCIRNLEDTVERLTNLRDETAERNLRLKEQNLRMAEMQDNEVHLATLKERNRIARDIHDNVGHMLTRALLQAAALNVINHDETMKEPLRGLKDTLDSAMTSMRESVHTLHDESIDLKRVVEESIAAVDQRFTVQLDYDLGLHVPANIRLCLAGIIKEGLNNAVKHSSGNRILIVLREHPAFYQLALEDNGNCKEIKETGIGLKNMRERVQSVGGRIRFTPSAEGFRIFLSIPKENV